MKKLTGLLLVTLSAATLSACASQTGSSYYNRTGSVYDNNQEDDVYSPAAMQQMAQKKMAKKKAVAKKAQARPNRVERTYNDSMRK